MSAIGLATRGLLDSSGPGPTTTATLTSVVASIEATIKAIIPTDLPSRRFRLVSSDRETVRDQSVPAGTERDFEVWPLEGTEMAATGEGYSHPDDYASRWTFLVEVVYPLRESLRDMVLRAQSDRHDIKVAIENQSNWITNVILQVVREWPPGTPDIDDGRLILSVPIEVQFLEDR